METNYHVSVGQVNGITCLTLLYKDGYTCHFIDYLGCGFRDSSKLVDNRGSSLGLVNTAGLVTCMMSSVTALPVNHVFRRIIR